MGQTEIYRSAVVISLNAFQVVLRAKPYRGLPTESVQVIEEALKPGNLLD
jgi:hypothetical protein